MERVKISPLRVRDALGRQPFGASEVSTRAMADLVFVLLSIAVFALLGLVVKGVERL
jgi:hypothetical protein